MIFVVPESQAQPSGGNLYNRLLLRALRKKGVRAEALTVGPAISRLKRSRVGSYWVDSLCLDELERFLKLKGEELRIYALIHDLPSLEPGLSLSARGRRAAREKKLLSRVSGFLVTSRWTESLLLEYGLAGKPILVVPPAPAVLSSRFRPPVRGFIGLMVNNLIRRKGILEFLSCLARQLKESDTFTLLIAGRSDIDPDFSRRCLNLINRHPRLRTSVEFLGPLRPAGVKRCYENSSVFISASRMETFGMAIQEALAFGLPVLALDAGNVKHLLSPERTGLLFRTMPALAKACARYIRDPDALETLQRRARRFVPMDHYDWEDAAQLFLEQLSG